MNRRSHRVSDGSVTAVQIVLSAFMVLAAGITLFTLPVRAQETPADSQIAQALCPASAESWDILFLMDESQSLRDNDPNRDRIGAAKRYISTLEEIADFGTGIRIRIALAAFGNEFDLRMDFRDLRREGAIDEMHEVIDGFGADDLNTDYVLALYGALDLDWSAACNRVVWLTDGQHDLGDAYRGDQSPRPYDGLQRRIARRSVAREVEELLIPAVCGVVDGTADDVAPGYGDLRSRVEDLGVEIEDHLYYVGEFAPGDTKTLIDRMETGDCGRPMNPYPLPDWIPPPVCGGLPEPFLPAGRDVVWSGDLPDGVAPAFVRSVIVQATGASPRLTTDHPFHRLEGEGPIRRLSLDFTVDPWSPDRREDVAVRGEGVDEACVGVVVEAPSLEAQVTTDRIFPDTPIDLSITIDGRTPTTVDERFLEVRLDGVTLSPAMVEKGSVRIPPQDLGGHTFEVRMVSDHASPAIATGDFNVEPKPAACEGLPEPHMPAGRDVVWSGGLPDGVAPAFVRSVIVQATGDRPELSSDHPSRILEEDGDFRRLILDFSGEPFSSYSPSDLTVSGEGVEESCLAVVLEPPAVEAVVVTSPIFPDTSAIEVAVQIDGNPITAADAGFMTVLIDGERSQQPKMTDEGRFEIPISATPGDHTFEVIIESGYADPAIAAGAVTVSLKPDGPILSLAGDGLHPVAATEFTIPVIIDDEGRRGEIRLLPTEPIVGTDGAKVGAEVAFPDGRSVWSSGDPIPDALTVILDESVQTPENHVMRFVYESHPRDPDGDTRRIPLAVPVDLDHPRNQVLEQIIVAILLALLLLMIWAWLYVINRVAGRIRRPKRDVRWMRFRVEEGWTLPTDPPDATHRRPKHTWSRLEAGRLRAARKTYIFRVWKSPTTELSMSGSRRFIGLVGDGFQATEISGKSRELHESRLHRPIVMVDVSQGPPFEGVVMAPTDPAKPTAKQLTDYARRVLERLSPPDQ